jgi:hypothetical protein
MGIVPSPDELGWGPACPAAKIVPFRAGGVTITAHRDAAPIFAAFITDIVGRGYEVDAVADDWGYNCRPIRGSTNMSWHAWGLAIDLNASKNPMGPTLITDMPPWIDEVAAQYGIFWGGNFNRRKDAMHFELHLTPAQAKSVRERLEGFDMDEETFVKLVRQGVREEVRVFVRPDNDPTKEGSSWFDGIRADVRAILKAVTSK